MRRPQRTAVIRACAAGAAVLLIGARLVPGQTPSETFTARASVNTPGGAAASAPVTIVVKRFAADADRNAMIAAIRKHGTVASRLLATSPDAGVLQLGMQRTAIKYASQRPSAHGRLITLLTAEPIPFVGAGRPDVKARTGSDLGLVRLEVPPSGSGSGELVPAAKVKVDAYGAIETEDYSDVVVRLLDAVRQ